LFRNTKSLTESLSSFSVFSFLKVNFDVDHILIDPLWSPVINESLENKATEDIAESVFVVVNIEKLFKISQIIIVSSTETLIKYSFWWTA